MYKKIQSWLGFQGNAPTLSPPQDNKRKSKIKDDSLFGYLFSRIEIILIVVMAVLALNLYFSFVEYISENAKFLKDEAHRFSFASRLVGSLLFVEIVLAIATSYFRNLNQWDKSIFTAVLSFVVALFNHWTIDEMFANYLANQSNLDIDSIQWKMLLSNWLVFTLGEAIGFVMHSKGNQDTDTDQTPHDILSEIKQFLQHQEPSPAPVYDSKGQLYKVGFEYKEKDRTHQDLKSQPLGQVVPDIYSEIETMFKDGLDSRSIATLYNQKHNLTDSPEKLSKNAVIKIRNRYDMKGGKQDE